MLRCAMRQEGRPKPIMPGVSPHCLPRYAPDESGVRVSQGPLTDSPRSGSPVRGDADNAGKSVKVGRLERSDQSDRSDKAAPYNIATASVETAANTLIRLINQASFLPGRQLRRLEEQFVSAGGFTERLHRERRARRICQ
jgi:four helix bundle suffix protein